MVLQGRPQSLSPLAEWLHLHRRPQWHMVPTACLLTHLEGRLVSVSARVASLHVSKHSCCLFVLTLPTGVEWLLVVISTCRQHYLRVLFLFFFWLQLA